MGETGNRRPTDDLAALNRTFNRIRAATPDERTELVAEFLLHPVSQAKLRAACGCVLKQWASRQDLVADISQQAILLVTERMNRETIPFEQRPLPQFEGWVWRLWLTSCQQAWRGYRRQMLHNRPLSGADAVAHDSPQPTSEIWCDIQLAVSRLDHPLQRKLMFDWMSGLNGYESAELRDIPPSSVFRHRRQAVKSIRSQLSRSE